MTEAVTLVEMAPRDGLQNEPQPVATEQKIALIDRLSQTGLTRIEAASFVSPKWVPQMADAAAVMAGINRMSGVTYSALAPNLRGAEAAVVSADEIAVFASASEGFSRANINCSISESLTRFEEVIAYSLSRDVPVRGYVSCITDCPFDGPVEPKQTALVARALLDLGCFEVSLGDTIGAATPQTTQKLLDEIVTTLSPDRLAGHFHDTRGQALANIDVCLAAGLRIFDASAGGLGGCPYAPGAAGNVATEAVEDHLTKNGYVTGLDAGALAQAAEFAQSLRSRS